MGDAKRAVVRAGYDQVAGRYVSDRPTDAADVALLPEFVAGVLAGRPVLDAGCGAGVPVAAHVDAAGIDVVGLDFSGGQLALARTMVPRVQLVQGDLAALPFADATFGGVVSYYAVIHVPRTDHPKVLGEFHRVLAPGGSALLCLGANDNPADEDPDAWLGAPMFWSHYDAPTNRQLLRDAGFELIWDRLVPDPMDHGQHLFVLATRC